MKQESIMTRLLVLAGIASLLAACAIARRDERSQGRAADARSCHGWPPPWATTARSIAFSASATEPAVCRNRRSSSMRRSPALTPASPAGCAKLRLAEPRRRAHLATQAAAASPRRTGHQGPCAVQHGPHHDRRDERYCVMPPPMPAQFGR